MQARDNDIDHFYVYLEGGKRVCVRVCDAVRESIRVRVYSPRQMDLKLVNKCLMRDAESLLVAEGGCWLLYSNVRLRNVYVGIFQLGNDCLLLI